jgi:hypothetical protein
MQPRTVPHTKSRVRARIEADGLVDASSLLGLTGRRHRAGVQYAARTVSVDAVDNTVQLIARRYVA